MNKTNKYYYSYYKGRIKVPKKEQKISKTNSIINVFNKDQFIKNNTIRITLFRIINSQLFGIVLNKL